MGWSGFGGACGVGFRRHVLSGAPAATCVTLKVCASLGCVWSVSASFQATVCG